MDYFPFCCQQLLDVYYMHMIIKYLYVWPFVQQTEHIPLVSFLFFVFLFLSFDFFFFLRICQQSNGILKRRLGCLFIMVCQQDYDAVLQKFSCSWYVGRLKTSNNYVSYQYVDLNIFKGSVCKFFFNEAQHFRRHAWCIFIFRALSEGLLKEMVV